MTEEGPAPGGPGSREAVTEIWSANAAFWDSKMGEGNLTHFHLVSPSVERLLEIRAGESVLEIACGNGQLARRLASLGARVLATDASESMLVHARQRAAATHPALEYRLLDAAEPGAFDQLLDRRFDAVVCSMALMDMPDLDVLAAAIPGLLSASGRFVFAVPHPCFNGSRTRRQIEEEDTGGTLAQRGGVFISRYATPRIEKGFAILGQPRPQWYFDRPMHVLLRPFFAAGLALDALEEPTWPEGVAPNRPTSWIALHEIPQIMVGRLRAGRSHQH